MSMVSFISVSTETLTGLGSANLLSILVDKPRWQYKLHYILPRACIKIWHFSYGSESWNKGSMTYSNMLILHLALYTLQHTF